ncbi:MAG: alpha/beta hydrolase [Actinomycetota bacterium]|nr:alpha/beta hydrolase [Actinomycetota bacterium]
MLAFACAVSGLLFAAPAAEAQVFHQNGVLFVHGYVGSGAQFESQKMRLMSNGYPESWVTAIDYDSLFASESRSDVYARIDRLVAELEERTGRPQVDILGHSLGTTVMGEYLTSSEARAANVAHYVNIDGRQPDAPPGGVPTLAIWAGRGAPGRRIPGAKNVTVPNQTHVESATSAESFAAFYEFFTGKPPAHDIVPQAGDITIAGKVLQFPVNRGAVDATLEIWEVDGESGQRTGSSPVARTSIPASGEWGPVEVQAGRHYEFAVLRPGVPTHHHYYEPFVRSDHLIRLLESDLLSNVGERGPRHVAGLILRYKELWGDQGSQNDLLSLNGTNVCVDVLCPIRKQVNAVFVFDRNLDGRTDLSSPHPGFDALPFIVGVDIFLPAAIPATGKTTLELRSRGGGPPRTVNFPNFASATDVVTVQLRDFEEPKVSACMRPSTVAFKLHRMRGTRVVRVEAYVNGGRALRRSGRDLRRVKLTRLPRDGRMKVRIVATHSTGSKVVSTRSWDGCKKGKPRVWVVRR